jgi:hypothetical protein
MGDCFCKSWPFVRSAGAQEIAETARFGGLARPKRFELLLPDS